MNDLPSMFLLMATRDRSGKPMGYHHYGFGAAVLGEMALQGVISLAGRRVNVRGAAPQDALYASVWHDIAVQRKPRKASWWVNRLSGRRYGLLRRQFSQRLVTAGTLGEEPTWWGGYRYPSLGSGAEQQVRAKVWDAITDRDQRDSRIVCLVAILVASGSAKELHPDRSQRRVLRREAKQWIKQDELAKAVQEIIAAVTAAIVAVSVAASAGS